MNSYAVIFHGGNHFFFGGSSDGQLDSILRLSGNSWTWSKVGQLNALRQAHGVILVEDTFTVVGGTGIKKNEACVLNNEQLTCTELASSLTNYEYYPILYLVGKDYETCQ